MMQGVSLEGLPDRRSVLEAEKRWKLTLIVVRKKTKRRGEFETHQMNDNIDECRDHYLQLEKVGLVCRRKKTKRVGDGPGKKEK